ncbi:hypothetical protein BJ170DRAFT_646108 [Xylariales sp. AK1849]|nr:hypothetical protein BJ170DRAFT_646108 [Xylariales sp. AK1849]
MSCPEQDAAPPIPSELKVRRIKRPRVAVACKRCKTRKQKCTGVHPCSNCRDFGAICEYLPPKSVAISREHQKSVQAVQAVEDRVTELESILRREGLAGHGQKRKHGANEDGITCSPSFIELPARNRSTPSSAPSELESDVRPRAPGRIAVSTVVEILRDLSVEPSGGHIGASSQITMSRMISSIVQAREYSVDNTVERACSERLRPKVANTASCPL